MGQGASSQAPNEIEMKSSTGGVSKQHLESLRELYLPHQEASQPQPVQPVHPAQPGLEFRTSSTDEGHIYVGSGSQPGSPLAAAAQREQATPRSLPLSKQPSRGVSAASCKLYL